MAAGANGTTLYKADLLQGNRSFQVSTTANMTIAFWPAVSRNVPDAGVHLQVAVKKFNIDGASVAAEVAS